MSGAEAAGQGDWMELEATDSRGDRWMLWYAYRLDGRWYRRTLPMQVQYGVKSLVSAPLSAVVALQSALSG